MDNNAEGLWDDVVLEEGEVRRIINAFLTNPSRQSGGASEEEITQVLLWAREIKLKAAININILRLIYLEEMTLNLNEAGEVTMQTLHKDKPTFAPDIDQIEGWLDV